MKVRLLIVSICSIIYLSSCQNDKPGGAAAPAERPTTSQKAAPTKATNSRPTQGMTVTVPSYDGDTPAATRKPIDINQAQGERVLAKSKAQKQQEEQKAKSLKVYKGKTLPSACDLVAPKFIADVIGGVDAKSVFVKDGSGKNATDAKACFFKWDDKGNPNGGVLVQVQRNPLPDEFPDWASYYVNGKKNQGDQMPDGSGTHRYKNFPGIGLAGAYNYDLARYVWRNETDNVFMVAFNLESSEAEQLIWAEKIGKELMKNFMKVKGRN